MAGSVLWEQMRLLLIRHGQTPSNVAGALDTAYPGAGLTDLGQTQAAAIPGSLEADRFAGVYASPLLRTQLTAAPLARRYGLPVVVRTGLQEISAGELEMRTDKDAVQRYQEALASWLDGDLSARLGGRESGRDFLQRYDGAVTSIARSYGSDDTVVAVSHGAAIRVWVTLRAEGASDVITPESRMSNTAAAMLEGDAHNGWRLVSWHSAPLGGEHLADEGAHDVTGDPADEAVAEAAQPRA